jgi:ParB family chromosome partitioning protein
VSNTLRLLNLHDKVQQLLSSNQLDMGHARALLSLDSAQQISLANQIVMQQLSVRDAEALVKKTAQKPSAAVKPATKSRDVLSLQESLAEKIGFPILIECNAKGAGMLKVKFSTLDQLDQIIKKF